jgi:hypothetical protein
VLRGGEETISKEQITFNAGAVARERDAVVVAELGAVALKGSGDGCAEEADRSLATTANLNTS